MSLGIEERLKVKNGSTTLTTSIEPCESEQDLPPEFCHYRDTGCEYAASCLDCPFRRCLFEEPGGRQRYLKQERDKEMVRLFLSEGREVEELALSFRVSERTVQRVLKSAKAGGDNGSRL